MEQNYANHRRFMPLYHYVLSLLMLVALACSLVLVYRAFAGGYDRLVAVMILLLVIIALIEAGLLRIFPLKAQDRAIRAEENLRHYVLYGSLLDPGLTTRQIIGLRFAGDEELGSLAKRAVEENLSENDIKKAVKTWRADNYRV